MRYAYNIKLENGTTVKFNHIGIDKEIDGELPTPIYSTEYYSIYKQEGVLNNGYIRCIILYNDGHVNYNNVTWSENLELIVDPLHHNQSEIILRLEHNHTLFHVESRYQISIA